MHFKQKYEPESFCMFHLVNQEAKDLSCTAENRRKQKLCDVGKEEMSLTVFYILW